MDTKQKTKVPMCRCSKEEKIDGIEGKLEDMEKGFQELNKVVHKSTNGDSLLGMARNTNKTVKEMGADVRALLTFQTVVETQREMNDMRQEKKTKRQMVQIALVGLISGAVLTFLSMILSAVIK